MTKQAKTVREIALHVLERIEQDGSYSHLLIDQAIKKAQLSSKDAKLLTEMVYGTISHKLTLEYFLQPYLKTKKEPEKWVLLLLLMSLYQMVYLDKVPTYAVLHEAVEIAKKRGHKGIASFVNGVLRNFSRNGPEDITKISDPIKRLALETSHPEWLVRRWLDHYGYEVTATMCQTNLQKKPLSVRVNTLKTTVEEVRDLLIEQGFSVEQSRLLKDALIIHSGNVIQTGLLEKGWITIQDQASMLATLALDVEPGMNVLDTCSAPGGKVTYIGELMQNKGNIYAHDLHEKKIALIENNSKRLGITNIKASKYDARKLQDLYENESFDRIIVDAPCTGYGVIRTKPDIKYRKQLQDSENLHQIQRKILQEIAPLLKINGKLVYSTCTVEKLENEVVIEHFLEKNTTFIVDREFLQESKKLFPDASISAYGVQLFPQTLNADGFFISRLIKRNK